MIDWDAPVNLNDIGRPIYLQFGE